jgi:uncharacterized membrane protein YeaQ/YmgE (transglycosylase-associated protein family)
MKGEQPYKFCTTTLARNPKRTSNDLSSLRFAYFKVRSAPSIDSYQHSESIHRKEYAVTMSLSQLLLLIVIAAVCGAIGKAIAGSSRGGLIVSIALGFIGALLGPWVARSLKLPEPFMITIGGHPFPILWSIIGAALFVVVIHLFSRRRW